MGEGGTDRRGGGEMRLEVLIAGGRAFCTFVLVFAV